jgi:hypothetical protein
MKGYARFDFEDAWSRYLPPTPTEASQASHPSHSVDPSHENPREHWDVTDVTDVTDRSGEGGPSRHTAVNERHNGAPVACVRVAEDETDVVARRGTYTPLSSHSSHEGAIQNGDGRESCAQHPNAGHWRFAASDFWMCLGCYPCSAEDASGVEVEPSRPSVEGSDGTSPPEASPDAPSAHGAPVHNGHEPLATPEEEALLERATRLIGGDL